MGRGFRAFHTLNPANPGGYSIVLEQRGKNDVVLFENYAVATLSVNEFEVNKKNYTKFLDAYGCLGVLRINEGKRF